MQANSHITTTELANQLDVSRQTIATNIKKMQEAGLIRRVGPDKGGHWEVIDSDK
ncbi:MAG: winged helix-turn-helix transcriptional regulator [Bacteroidales bacterium]|nr:winged helix-turn-helix transcriptional regulator [Bacteroidales bacterium]